MEIMEFHYQNGILFVFCMYVCIQVNMYVYVCMDVGINAFVCMHLLMNVYVCGYVSMMYVCIYVVT